MFVDWQYMTLLCSSLLVLNPFSLSLGSLQILRWKVFSPPIRTPSTSSRVSPSLQGESGEWSDYINIYFLFVSVLSPTHLDCGRMPDMLWENRNCIWFTSCILCVRCLEVFFITFCHTPVTCLFIFLRFNQLYPMGCNELLYFWIVDIFYILLGLLCHSVAYRSFFMKLSNSVVFLCSFVWALLVFSAMRQVSACCPEDV